MSIKLFVAPTSTFSVSSFPKILSYSLLQTFWLMDAIVSFHSFHKINENEFFTWASFGIWLWSVNHKFHRRNENDIYIWVSSGILLLWSVNHTFHKINENEFFTWVSLGILLSCSVYHIFHKRNENDVSTWVSLGIFLLWSVNHSFHKINENEFFTWVSLGIYFEVFLMLEKCDFMEFRKLKAFFMIFKDWKVWLNGI